MGSVKDLVVQKPPTPEKEGDARFIFSDRYSIFDWGEMPDHIPNKGAAITILAAYFFEKLGGMNIPSHYTGLVEDNAIKKISEAKNPSNTMSVKLLRVIKPTLEGNKYDYSKTLKEKACFLIPLEIIYRNYLPSGSSVFRRIKEGEITPQELGLDREPHPNQKLDPPILDVSTKLEITDRYLTWAEAQQISGLSDDEIIKLKNLTSAVNNLITEEFSNIGLLNEDGKIETGFDSRRRLILVDVLGTLDECRFTFNGFPVSKEIARIYYRNTPWYKEVEEAKKRDRQNWKSICKLTPDPMPEKLRQLISQIYCACTNEITQKEWFENIPPLKKILEEIEEFVKI